VLRKLALVMMAALALLVLAPSGATSLKPQMAEAYPGADNFTITGQDCISATNVRLYMQWTTYGFGPQWFDVSLQNNGWIWNTFVGTGPIAPNQGTYVWEGFVPGARHYLRVNTLTSVGWYESATVSFVTRTCFGGGGGGTKVGPHCDGATWCAGDPIPSFCAQQGLYNGCIWTDRSYTNPFSYTPGAPIAICYWLPYPGQVHIQTQRTPGGGITVNLNSYDDGRGDCLHGTAGLTGDRRTTLQLNGVYVDQVLWRVN
jgi:hypothetical protein